MLPDLIRAGDRFRTTRPYEVIVTYVQYAPSHTVGGKAELPSGTVIVALNHVPGAAAFVGYPEAYEEMEKVLVPESERTSPSYARSYGLTLMVEDIGEALERMRPLDPRPSGLPKMTDSA